jgi:hypothetical protein
MSPRLSIMATRGWHIEAQARQAKIDEKEQHQYRYAAKDVGVSRQQVIQSAQPQSRQQGDTQTGDQTGGDTGDGHQNGITGA